MKYSVVIPTYNNCEKYLKPCIESILKYTDVNDIQLIVVANGCTDNTIRYLNYVSTNFPHCLIAQYSEALGFSKATNVGIKMATCDKIILLNNDNLLLQQNQNDWLNILNTPFQDPDCGISCIIKTYSPPAGKEFAIFFCVMIAKKVFDTIGLLNEEYGVGGGEDTEFSIEAEKAGFKVLEVFDKHWGINQFTGEFPIYHKGEGTVHDKNLVSDYDDVFYKNSLKLAKKYNLDHYRYLLSNNYERAVFLKGDPVFPRESARYNWARQNYQGLSILEIGCSTGYGCQFFPDNINYLGIDYDPIIINVAKEQGWRDRNTFISADINNFNFTYYDTIIAFEVIEHLDNGLEIIEKLKKHCNRLLISVPWNEPKGFWGEHHKLHNLNESHFKGFEFEYINHSGICSLKPEPLNTLNLSNLMLCKYSAQ
jgi:glycosyltransferase involved in cell wall biosynthesis